jgi:putative oxidoreductase
MDRQSSTSFMADLGLLLMRLMLAAVFLFHGSQKIFGVFGGKGIEQFAQGLESMDVPVPLISAWAAALAEFLGGVFLVLGTGMRFVIPFTAFTMLVAALKVHGKAFSLEHGGMEYALTLAIMLIGLTLIGPGRFSISKLFGSKKR